MTDVSTCELLTRSAVTYQIGVVTTDLERDFHFEHTCSVSSEASPPATFPPGASVTQFLRARFVETDAMGVVHHASFLSWLEVARVELLRAAGHPYDEVRASGIDFAVVDVRVHYERPVKFDDEVAIEVRLGDVTKAAFVLDYVVRVGASRCATAATRHAALGTDGRPRRLPPWLAGLAKPSGTAG